MIFLWGLLLSDKRSGMEQEVNDGKSENPAIFLPEKEVKKGMRLILCNLPAGKWTVNGKIYEVSHESKILIAD